MTGEPIITDTTIPATGKRSVQIWGVEKTGSKYVTERTNCAAAIYLDNGNAVEFTISSMCPREWVDTALACYQAVRTGADVEATHTITWPGSGPKFTPIEREFTLSEPRSNR